jgi:hypothetical protein
VAFFLLIRLGNRGFLLQSACANAGANSPVQ